MVLKDVFERFIEDSPVSVMFRATMQNVFSADRLDEIFRATAEEQYEDELLFSTCVDLLGAAVARVHRSVNGAYQKQKEQIGVAVQSVYNKLAGVEPAVCAALVAATADHLKAVLKAMHAPCDSPLPGFEVRIVDGNHLAGTEHRLQELRTMGAAALPGHALAVLNPQRRLLERVVLCEDGHASQRPLLRELLPLVRPGECWIADRDCCTRAFLFGIRQQHAYFIARHHAQLSVETLGRRRKLGRTKTGVVYEQRAVLTDAAGQRMRIRRITVELDQPTRDGEREIHLLTNLPLRVAGRRIAEAYRARWRIETAFQHLAVSLRGEVNTLAYPRAALFGFAIALMLYNVLSVTRAAIEVAQKPKLKHAAKTGRKVSLYALAEEVAGTYRGMMIAIPAEHWQTAFTRLTAVQLAAALLRLAKKVRLHEYLTYRQYPKRPPPKRTSGYRGKHNSTYQVLQQRKNR